MQSGPAISVWLKMSGVGVRTAAMMKLIRIAYFRFFDSICGVTTPSRAAIVMMTGSSKTAPNASVNFSANASPAMTAIEDRMMRVRSSPRCSRNGIESARDVRGISSPVGDEVAEDADAVARLEAFLDGAPHVGLGVADGVHQRAAAGKTGGDRRREGAAGPVGVPRLDARGVEA